MGQSLDSRARYIPDGGMRTQNWPLLLGGSFLAAVAGGWLLYRLLVLNWYLTILVPAIASLLVGLVIALLVALVHCRKPVSAAVVGAIAGLVMYFGSFYFGMLSQLPPGNAHRIDLLPDYVVTRLKTDVRQDLAKPRAQNQPAVKPRLGDNVVAFALELGLVIPFAAFPGYRRARRPYVLGLGQWMAREEKRLPAGLLLQFRSAVDAGTLGEFVRWIMSDRAALAQAQIAKHYGSCVLEYVRDARTSPLDYPVYATFINDAAYWVGAIFPQRGNLRQVRLDPEEVLALRPLFPNLDRILTGFQEQPRAAGALRDAQRASAPPAAYGPAAVISEVPQGGTLRSGSFLLIVNLLGLIPLVPFCGGLALFPVAGWGWFRGWQATTIGACFVVGALGFVVGALLGQRYPGLFESWYRRRRLRSLLSLRGDAIVPTNDSAAIVVNMTRRENWVKVQLDVSDDSGLLTFDEKRHELRIEGDKRRYRIPFSSVALCEPECFHHPLDNKLLNQYWQVRLVVREQGAERELLFATAFSDWRPRTNENRRELAKQLCRRINKAAAPVLTPA